MKWRDEEQQYEINKKWSYLIDAKQVEDIKCQQIEEKTVPCPEEGECENDLNAENSGKEKNVMENTKSNNAVFNKVDDHGALEDVILDEGTIGEIVEMQEAQITVKGSDSHIIVESMDYTSPLSTYRGIEGYEKDNSSGSATHRRKQRLLPRQTSIEDEIQLSRAICKFSNQAKIYKKAKKNMRNCQSNDEVPCQSPIIQKLT